MKKLLPIALLVLSLSAKSQSFNMCSGSTVTTLQSGNIYDSGGPNSNYGYYEGCYFLIKSPCNGAITLNFSYFSTELNYDFLTVYNGSTTSSPVLGSYWGTGSIPQMIATSGSMLLYFYSDGSANMGGFAASWSSAACGPVANFNTNIQSCSGKVNFTDASTGTPTSWLWNFGDGNASTLQNPVHTYTAAGNYAVSLIAANSQGNSTVSKNVSVNPMQIKIGYNGQPLMGSLMSFTTDNSSGQVYTWNFGDGNVAGTVNANHTYNSMGTFTVSLTVTTGTCVNTKTMTVQINDGVGIEQASSLPFNAAIMPNPMDNGGSLNILVAKAGSLRIALYNQLGQEIKMIADENMSTGEHSFKIEDLSPGLYFVKINDGQRDKVLRFVSVD